MGTEGPRNGGAEVLVPGVSAPPEPPPKGAGTNPGTNRREALEAAVRAALDAGDQGLAAELLGLMRRHGDIVALPEGVVDLDAARARRAH